MKFCPMCGTEFARDANFCMKCGLSVAEYQKKLLRLEKTNLPPKNTREETKPPKKKTFAQIAAEMFEEGRKFEGRREYADAVKYYKLSSDLGNVESMMALGHLYEAGSGVPRSVRLALDYYERAAKTGNVKAMLVVGNLYERGRGIAQNYKQAMTWYKKAAQVDESGEALHRLGLMYMFGRGTKKNDQTSTKYFIEGAKKGNLHSISMVGVAYHFGGGVKRDLAKALICYKALAECDNPKLADFGLTHIEWISTGVRPHRVPPVPSGSESDDEQNAGESLLDKLLRNKVTLDTARLAIELLSMFGS